MLDKLLACAPAAVAFQELLRGESFRAVHLMGLRLGQQVVDGPQQVSKRKSGLRDQRLNLPSQQDSTDIVD